MTNTAEGVGAAAPTLPSTANVPTAEAPQRDLWVTLGLTVSAIAAAVSSFSGLYSLAVVTGYHEWLAALLPLCIDSYAATATRVWLTRSARSTRARRFAKWNAMGAILLSLLGNGAWHLIAARLLPLSWIVVLAVGAVPPVILGLVAHLAVLRGQVDENPVEYRGRPRYSKVTPAKSTGTVPVSSPMSRNRPGYATEDELLHAVREADAAYRAEHDGRPITRDHLRKVLRVSGQRATEIHRLLRAAQAKAE